MRPVSFLIQSNIFISLGAVFLTIATQVQIGMEPQWHPYLFIIFFATMFEYNLHRVITIIIKKEALEGDKHRWVKDHLRLFQAIVLLSAAGFLLAACLAKSIVLVTLAPIAVITLFYSFPAFKKNNFIFRLREIPLLKIFLIAFVWSAVTILLPLIHSGIVYDKMNLVLMFGERFMFIMAITIPFDIRDMEVDKKSGLKTIPLLTGEKMALRIAGFCLFLFLGFSVCHYHSGTSFILPAMIISGISTFYFLYNKGIRNTEYYYTGVLDGTLLIQGAMVCGAYYVNAIFAVPGFRLF